MERSAEALKALLCDFSQSESIISTAAQENSAMHSQTAATDITSLSFTATTATNSKSSQR